MNELNDRQRQAVEISDGPVLIVAGPGTGKTKTLIARIAHLVKQSVPPNRILALTFTNKSAREMQERLDHLLPVGKRPDVTTFHAFCYRLLADIAGEKPELISETDRQDSIRQLKKSQQLKGLSVKELSLAISQAKSSLETVDPDLADLLQQYQELLRERKQLDFDDLLMQAFEFLKAHPAKRPAYQHILVDEFQDTNELQYEFLKLLADTTNIFVIGDPKQSIYGFRGASAEIFDRFKRDWPGASVIALSINYRSTPQVAAVGNAVFSNSPSLLAHRQDAGQARCIEVLNEYSEAEWIINSIEQQIGGSTMLRSSDHHATQDEAGHFRDFAILYRTHRMAMTFRHLLDESGLPYQVAGEGSPYAQAEVMAIIEALRSAEQNDSEPVSKLITRKATATRFDPQSPPLRMLINAAVRFDDAGLLAYLEHLDTIAEQEFYDPAADAITLLTIHAAKGLEFRHVFLIGVEEGLLPHHRKGARVDMDEERRLFYVAVTRARDRLDILHTKKRGGDASKLSRFVSSMDPTILTRLNDPEMAAQQERLRKRAIKRSQTTLF